MNSAGVVMKRQGRRELRIAEGNSVKYGVDVGRIVFHAAIGEMLQGTF